MPQEKIVSYYTVAQWGFYDPHMQVQEVSRICKTRNQLVAYPFAL
jgi:hypothetical protein